MESARARCKVTAFWRTVFAGFAMLTLSAKVSTAAENGPAIGELLKTGWQIAGYSPGIRQSINFHPVPASGAKLSRAMPGRVRRNAQTSVYAICYELR